jgi:hypothetical protein
VHDRIGSEAVRVIGNNRKLDLTFEADGAAKSSDD